MLRAKFLYISQILFIFPAHGEEDSLELVDSKGIPRKLTDVALRVLLAPSPPRLCLNYSQFERKNRSSIKRVKTHIGRVQTHGAYNEKFTYHD